MLSSGVKNEFDILIVGGGLVGQVTALACTKLKNVSVALIDGQDIFDPKRQEQDGRAYALAASSVRLLENLGLDLSGLTQCMNDMLITDGPMGEEPPWRLHFGGDEFDASAAQMIESAVLSGIVSKAVKQTKAIHVFSPAVIENLTHNVSGVTGCIGGVDIQADLLIAADGKNSPIRTQAGINTDGRDYGQSALVTTISHSLPHDGLALQRFLPGGPLAALPLTDQRSQIVWSDKTAAIEAALAISESDFLEELSHRLGNHLGDISLVKQRQSYPLRLQLSQHYVGTRLALVGDAAHVIHPLAGQGLNLGLRDIAALYDVLKEALAVGRDIGGAALGEYAAWRKFDITALAAVTDGLSYLYGSPRGPISRPFSKAIGHMRRVGLSSINQSDFLKNQIMLEAAGAAGDSPSLLL